MTEYSTDTFDEEFMDILDTKEIDLLVGTNASNNLDRDDKLFALLDRVIDFESDKMYIKKIEKKTNKIRKFCTTCNTENYLRNDYHNGHIICTKCSEVVDVLMDELLEHNNGSGQQAKRCNRVTSIFTPEGSLGTYIPGSSYNKVRREHMWINMPYRERSLLAILNIISEKCKKGKIIGCIEDDAKIFYKNVSDYRHSQGTKLGRPIIIRGKNRLSLIAACIYYACLRKGKTRSPSELSTLFGIEYSKITKGLKLFKTMFALQGVEFQISAAHQYISRNAPILGIIDENLVQCIRIAKNAQKLHISSKHNPISIASACMLTVTLLNNINIDIDNLAKHFKISPLTIFKSYSKLEPYIEILIDDEKTKLISKLMEKERAKIRPTKRLRRIFCRIMEEEDTKLCKNKWNKDKQSLDVYFGYTNDVVRTYLRRNRKRRENVSKYISIKPIKDNIKITIK